MTMNFSKDPYKHMNEYIDYCLLKIENHDIDGKWFFVESYNKMKNNESQQTLEFLREVFYIFYNDEVDILDYNNFYRCKELNMTISGYR